MLKNAKSYQATAPRHRKQWIAEQRQTERHQVTTRVYSSSIVIFKGIHECFAIRGARRPSHVLIIIEYHRKLLI
jgi:hypothetical protein